MKRTRLKLLQEVSRQIGKTEVTHISLYSIEIIFLLPDRVEIIEWFPSPGISKSTNVLNLVHPEKSSLSLKSCQKILKELNEKTEEENKRRSISDYHREFE